jgi:putative protease
VYVLNRLAARQVLAMGARRVTLSPEDGLDNWRRLLPQFGPQATVVVYQDTPLFISESCAAYNLGADCPGPSRCRAVRLELDSREGEKLTALQRNCRTVVINRRPFALGGRLEELRAAGAVHLRADFLWRAYAPEEVCTVWSTLRAGRAVPGTHAGNFARGLL